MSNKDEFTVQLDPMDVTFLEALEGIPGETAEEKAAYIIEHKLQEIAESVIKQE